MIVIVDILQVAHIKIGKVEVGQVGAIAKHIIHTGYIRGVEIGEVKA